MSTVGEGKDGMTVVLEFEPQATSTNDAVTSSTSYYCTPARNLNVVDQPFIASHASVHWRTSNPNTFYVGLFVKIWHYLFVTTIAKVINLE